MTSIGMDLSPPTQSLEDIHFPLKFTPRGKRKRTHSPRQQESESAESIGSNSEVESKMEEQCQNMSELYKVNLFKELSLARFRIFPYEKYESWRDEALWMTVRSCLYPHHPYPPNNNVLRAVVQKFLQAYEQDNELKSFDTSLRNEIIKVFAPLDNNLGQLQSPSLNQAGLGPLLSLKYYCNPDNQLLLENKGVFQHCNSMGDGESSISGGIVSVQAGPFDPKVESTFDLKRIATNYGFTMEELGALEHLFLENASYGNLFLKLGSDKEKFEFLSRQIDVFNRKYGGNDRRTAKRKSRHG